MAAQVLQGALTLTVGDGSKIVLDSVVVKAVIMAASFISPRLAFSYLENAYIRDRVVRDQIPIHPRSIMIIMVIIDVMICVIASYAYLILTALRRSSAISLANVDLNRSSLFTTIFVADYVGCRMQGFGYSSYLLSFIGDARFFRYREDGIRAIHAARELVIRALAIAAVSPWGILTTSMTALGAYSTVVKLKQAEKNRDTVLREITHVLDSYKSDTIQDMQGEMKKGLSEIRFKMLNETLPNIYNAQKTALSALIHEWKKFRNLASGNSKPTTPPIGGNGSGALSPTQIADHLKAVFGSIHPKDRAGNSFNLDIPRYLDSSKANPADPGTEVTMNKHDLAIYLADIATRSFNSGLKEGRGGAGGGGTRSIEADLSDMNQKMLSFATHLSQSWGIEYSLSEKPSALEEKSTGGPDITALHTLASIATPMTKEKVPTLADLIDLFDKYNKGDLFTLSNDLKRSNEDHILKTHSLLNQLIVSGSVVGESLPTSSIVQDIRRSSNK